MVILGGLMSEVPLWCQAFVIVEIKVSLKVILTSSSEYPRPCTAHPQLQSVAVEFVSPIWSDQLFLCSRVGVFVPQKQHVNLRDVYQPERDKAGPLRSSLANLECRWGQSRPQRACVPKGHNPQALHGRQCGSRPVEMSTERSCGYLGSKGTQGGKVIRRPK